MNVLPTATTYQRTKKQEQSKERGLQGKPRERLLGIQLLFSLRNQTRQV